MSRAQSGSFPPSQAYREQRGLHCCLPEVSPRLVRGRLLEQLRDWLGCPHRNGKPPPSFPSWLSVCLFGGAWETRRKYPKWAPQADHEWPSHQPVHGAVPIYFSLTKAEPCCGRVSLSAHLCEDAGEEHYQGRKLWPPVMVSTWLPQPQDVGIRLKSGVKSHGPGRGNHTNI